MPASLALLLCAGCDRGGEPAARATPAAAPAAPASLAAALAGEQIPEDGRALFSFMMAKAPDLMAKVPCSCCNKMLSECYGGACPTSCEPCNRLGRAAYEWHREGISDDDIVARVRRGQADRQHY